MAIDPADKALRCGLDKKQQVLQDESMSRTHLCRTCRVPISATTRHCRICNKCVAGFDHHCVWLNTCIGARNRTPFFVYLLMLVFFLVVLLASAIFCGVAPYFLPELGTGRFCVFPDARVRMIMSVCVAMAAFIVLVFALQLAVLHARLRWWRITTYKYILMKERGERPRRAKRPRAAAVRDPRAPGVSARRETKSAKSGVDLRKGQMQNTPRRPKSERVGEARRVPAITNYDVLPPIGHLLEPSPPSPPPPPPRNAAIRRYPCLPVCLANCLTCGGAAAQPQRSEPKAQPAWASPEDTVHTRPTATHILPLAQSPTTPMTTRYHRNSLGFTPDASPANSCSLLDFVFTDETFVQIMPESAPSVSRQMGAVPKHIVATPSARYRSHHSALRPTLDNFHMFDPPPAVIRREGSARASSEGFQFVQPCMSMVASDDSTASAPALDATLRTTQTSLHSFSESSPEAPLSARTPPLVARRLTEHGPFSPTVFVLKAERAPGAAPEDFGASFGDDALRAVDVSLSPSVGFSSACEEPSHGAALIESCTNSFSDPRRLRVSSRPAPRSGP